MPTPVRSGSPKPSMALPMSAKTAAGPTNSAGKVEGGRNLVVGSLEFDHWIVEALGGGHAVEGVGEGGARLAAQQQAAGIAQRQDVLALQPALQKVEVRAQGFERGQEFQAQAPAVARE